MTRRSPAQAAYVGVSVSMITPSKSNISVSITGFTKLPEISHNGSLRTQIAAQMRR